MEFEKIINIRQSTREFSDKLPDGSVLNKILEAGRMAPTARNIQPVKIYILKSEKALLAIDKASPCRYGAPLALLVCTDTELCFNMGTHGTAEIDASIVATHLMLAATNEGVDSIWIERFDRAIIKSELGIPDNMLPVCLLPLGYRTEDCPVSRNFHNRKPIEEITEYI